MKTPTGAPAIRALEKDCVRRARDNDDAIEQLRADLKSTREMARRAGATAGETIRLQERVEQLERAEKRNRALVQWGVAAIVAVLALFLIFS